LSLNDARIEKKHDYVAVYEKMTFGFTRFGDESAGTATVMLAFAV
jgi:hypothetical protein